MAQYRSRWTGEVIDDAVGKAKNITYIDARNESASSAFAKAEAAYGKAEVVAVYTESDPVEQTLYLPCVLYQPNGIGVSQGVFLFSAEANNLQYQLILTESQWSPLYMDSMVMSSGGGMTGPLTMGHNRIKYLGTPTADSDAATKGYVDDEIDVVKSAINALTNLKYKFVPLTTDSSGAATVTSFASTYLPSGSTVVSVTCQRNGAGGTQGICIYNAGTDTVVIYNAKASDAYIISVIYV